MTHDWLVGDVTHYVWDGRFCDTLCMDYRFEDKIYLTSVVNVTKTLAQCTIHQRNEYCVTDDNEGS